MYRKLGDVTLKNGEDAELGVLCGPDNSALAQRLLSLLGHKGRSWQWQIEQSLSRENTGAEGRFYILLKYGHPFANIMTVERAGIGIFGHVYTEPAERRKGASEIIHNALFEDFKQRGGRALYLGTDFDSAPYRLYLKHGFKGTEPGSGYMYWFARDKAAFERELFVPSETDLEPLAFSHWPTLPALSMITHPARIRIMGMNIIGPRSTEGGSLNYLAALDPGASEQLEKRDLSMNAVVAVSRASGVPVAIAAVRADEYFWEQTDLLDMFCAPGFEAELPPLVAALQTAPGRSTICYSDEFWSQKSDVLRACGFSPAATLKRHAQSAGQVFDVTLWTK